MTDASVPFQAAGGIRDLSTAVATIETGAMRVILGTASVWDPELVQSIVSEVGAERVVGAVDVRDGLVHGSGWEDRGRPFDEVIGRLIATGVGRIMVTGILRDGTLAGPDVDLIRGVVERVPVPVIAAGGIGTLADLHLVADTGAEAVVIGRALYDGRFTLTEALAAVV
jgi:phosphoribosylanthranilate isomerase